MKYTDTFFEMPTKMFNRASVRTIIKGMEKDEDDLEEKLGMPRGTFSGKEDVLEALEEAQWTPACVKLLYTDILAWEDDYSVNRTYKDVKKNGPDCTSVEVKRLGTYICTWDKVTFEEKLNEHVEMLKKFEKPISNFR